MVTVSLLHNLNLINPFPHQNPIFSHQNPISSISLKPSLLRCSNSAIGSAPRRYPPIRMNHRTKIEAQLALCDYLHSTQSYTFIDADFISKNCPNFLRELIYRVRFNETDDEFHWVLKRYLMNNPINEFEPFLESIGVRHSELKLFLPKDLIFLSDESALVDNFHVLFSLGVPRNRMGKIYKEAREVFGYESGVLLKKFENYEKLGLSKSSLVKLFVCCPLLLVGDEVDPQFVVVLDWLRRIGIESDWFVSSMCLSRTYIWKTTTDTIEFFRQGGFSEKELYDLFKADPKLLEGLEMKTYLFIGRLIKSGLDVNEVCSCFKEHPEVLSYPRVNNLLYVITFMYHIRMDEDAIAHVLYNYMHLLGKHTIKGHRTMAKELRVGKADLGQMIQDDPLKFFSLALTPFQKKNVNEFYYDPRSHMEKTNFLRKLGYTDNSEEMEIAMKMFKGRGNKLQERFDCLVEAGLEYNTVVGMVKRLPGILSRSKTKMQKKIDFLKDSLGYPIETLAEYPTYFLHDLDKISARFTMYNWLKKRNAIKSELFLSTLISLTEKDFQELFVKADHDGPAAWESILSLSGKFKN